MSDEPDDYEIPLEGYEVALGNDLSALQARIEELEERLKAAQDDVKEAEAYAEEIYAHAKELEAKLGQGILIEYDDGSRVSLSDFSGGASEGGAWSNLTLMKEEQDGAVRFRRYTADGGWIEELTGGKDD